MTLLTVGLTLIAASGCGYEYLFARNTYVFDNPMALGWLGGLLIRGNRCADLSDGGDLCAGGAAGIVDRAGLVVAALPPAGDRRWP